MRKRNQIILLIILLSLLFLMNYSFLDSFVKSFFEEGEIVVVDRVIDGDTIVSNKTSIRLLGINCPETGEKYASEAKKFLEERILNESVKLIYGKEKTDLYGRTLAYVFIGGENINRRLIEEGLANPYFPSGKDMYYNDFMKDWEKCINNGKNLCEKSDNNCIKLKEFNHNSEIIILENICSSIQDLGGWEIKDEGRKKFIFPNLKLEQGDEIKIQVGDGIDLDSALFWRGENYVWTRTGDTLFLRDDNGKLVLWSHY